MKPTAIRDFGHGDPARRRVVCTACSTLAYADQIEFRSAEHLVKDACPRKPRCRPWADRGCTFERREGLSHEPNVPALPQADP